MKECRHSLSEMQSHSPVVFPSLFLSAVWEIQTQGWRRRRAERAALSLSLREETKTLATGSDSGTNFLCVCVWEKSECIHHIERERERVRESLHASGADPISTKPSVNASKKRSRQIEIWGGG